MFSLHLSSFLDAPLIVTQLPPGNVNRIVDEKLGGGVIVREAKIHASNHRSIDSLFPCQNQSVTFFVPAMFARTGWKARSLHIVELLALWDYPVAMVQHLSSRHQRFLWDRLATPSRVLGLVLRSFLACERSSEGVKIGGIFGSNSKFQEERSNSTNEMKVNGKVEVRTLLAEWIREHPNHPETTCYFALRSTNIANTLLEQEHRHISYHLNAI